MSDPVSYAFDVASILSIGTPCADPLPTPALGEIVLRIPDGLSLKVLRDSEVGKRLVWHQIWYNDDTWSQDAPPAGVYRLRVPVPHSNRKTASEQQAMLPEGEAAAPVALVAAALLCIHIQAGADPLQNGWTRCLELTAVGCRAVLTWSGGRLGVSVCWDGSRVGSLWASSVR